MSDEEIDTLYDRIFKLEQGIVCLLKRLAAPHAVYTMREVLSELESIGVKDATNMWLEQTINTRE